MNGRRGFAFLASAACIAAPLAAQSVYPIVWDAGFDARAGAHGLLTLERGLALTEDRLLPARIGDERGWSKAAGIGYRIAKLGFLDLPVDGIAFLSAHEVFGHGSRLREFGFDGIEYGIDAPAPYGEGTGFTQYNPGTRAEPLTGTEAITIDLAGIEASSIAARLLEDRWMLRGAMHYREATRYFITANDGLAYILRSDGPNPGSDILGYIDDLNATYAGAGTPLTLDDLQRQSLVSLLNPFVAYTIYATYVGYVVSGRREMKVPMIGLGHGMRLLPRFRFRLAPYGPEFELENTIVRDDRLLGVSLRVGDGRFHSTWGAGVKMLNLVRTPAVSVSGAAAIWRQPPLTLGRGSLRTAGGGMGGSVSAALLVKLSRLRGAPVGLYAEGGLKTAGFLEGEALDGGAVLRLGVGLEAR